MRAPASAIRRDWPSTGEARRLGALLGLLAMAALALAGCKGRGQRRREGVRPPSPVRVAQAQRRTVPVQLKALGTVESLATVSLRSQVTGQLVKVHFKEGDEVEVDQVLFELEPRPFELALAQAQATLARSEVLAQNARIEEHRYAPPAKSGMASQLDYAARVATRRAAEATVRENAAAVDNARVNLNYATLRSPIAGRTGNLLVHPGNLVQANSSTPLVVIRQLNPIEVSFSVPARHLSEIRRLQEQSGPLRVAAAIPGEQGYEEGSLRFIDNAVDAATGTILLKGSFDNPRRALWPGQFVNVTLLLRQLSDTVVVPSAAIQQGQQGPFLFVVQPDSTVQLRQVRTGPILRDLQAVAGVRVDERVVIDGQLGLVPGGRVQVKQEPAPRGLGGAGGQ